MKFAHNYHTPTTIQGTVLDCDDSQGLFSQPNSARSEQQINNSDSVMKESNKAYSLETCSNYSDEFLRRDIWAETWMTGSWGQERSGEEPVRQSDL